jgi:hypothetical protein
VASTLTVATHIASTLTVASTITITITITISIAGPIPKTTTGAIHINIIWR